MFRKFLLAAALVCSTFTAQANTEFKVLIGQPQSGGVAMNLQHLSTIAKYNNLELTPVHKVGAAGAIAMKEFLETTDPKQLMYGGTGTIVSKEVVFKKVPAYSSSDYRSVILTSKVPLMLVTPAASNKIQSFDELFRPGCNKRVNVAIGGFTHELFARLLAKHSTCEIVVLVYPSEPGSMADSAAGVIDIAVTTTDVLTKLGGKMIASTASPKDLRYNVQPTFSKYIPDSEFYLFYGLLASKHMDNTMLNNLIVEIKKAWEVQEYQKKHPIADGLSEVQFVYGAEFDKEIVRTTRMLRSISEKLDLQK